MGTKKPNLTEAIQKMELQKLELEKDKLDLEVKSLSRPWYENLEMWKVIIPALAIVLSLYFAFGQGFLDTEKSKLELQKETLISDIRNFKIKRAKLKAINKVQLKALTSLNIQVEKLLDKTNGLIKERKKLSDEIIFLNSKVGNDVKEISILKSKIDDDKNFYLQQIK